MVKTFSSSLFSSVCNPSKHVLRLPPAPILANFPEATVSENSSGFPNKILMFQGQSHQFASFLALDY